MKKLMLSLVMIGSLSFASDRREDPQISLCRHIIFNHQVDPSIFAFHVGAGASLTTPDPIFKHTPLETAAIAENSNAMNYICRIDATLRATGRQSAIDKEKALYQAVTHGGGHLSSIQLLVSHGAKVSWAMISMADVHGKNEIKEYLELVKGQQ